MVTRAGRDFVYTDYVYTGDAVDDLEGFDWDAANVSHILRHGVIPSEVEEVATRPNVRIPARSVGTEERWKLFGKTATNRYLVVVFTIRSQRFRTVTAYEMNAVERTRYGAQIE